MAAKKTTSDGNGGAVAAAERRIASRLPELIDLQFELARGVRVEKQTADGPVVYKIPPDGKALEYLLNRVMGKPTTRIDAERWGLEREALEHMRRRALEAEANRQCDASPTDGGDEDCDVAEEWNEPHAGACDGV